MKTITDTLRDITSRVDRLEHRLRDAYDLLSNIALNARTIPDPVMEGTTDISAVPLDDISAIWDFFRKGNP